MADGIPPVRKSPHRFLQLRWTFLRIVPPRRQSMKGYKYNGRYRFLNPQYKHPDIWRKEPTGKRPDPFFPWASFPVFCSYRVYSVYLPYPRDSCVLLQTYSFRPVLPFHKWTACFSCFPCRRKYDTLFLLYASLHSVFSALPARKQGHNRTLQTHLRRCGRYPHPRILPLLPLPLFSADYLPLHGRTGYLCRAGHRHPHKCRRNCCRCYFHSFPAHSGSCSGFSAPSAYPGFPFPPLPGMR